jgi:hypothetical protein
MATRGKVGYPSDVTDEEWAFVLPYLLLSREDSAHREHDLRAVFNGVRYIARMGNRHTHDHKYLQTTRLNFMTASRNLLKKQVPVASYINSCTSLWYAWRRAVTKRDVQLCVAGSAGSRGSSFACDPQADGRGVAVVERGVRAREGLLICGPRPSPVPPANRCSQSFAHAVA